MRDSVTLERIKLLHPRLRDEAYDVYNEICKALGGVVGCRFTHTLRTFAEQDALYAQGRTRPGNIVTKAKGGLSLHNYGLACDFCLLIDKNRDGVYELPSWDERTDYDGDHKYDWEEVINIFKQYGWECGIDWKFRDAPHCQKSFGYSVRDLLSLHTKGKVDKNGYVLI